jgi:hypothetical protein
MHLLVIPAHANSHPRRHRWQQWLALLRLENRTAVPTGQLFCPGVTVAHYPTGASKSNPIEHRLFSEVSRKWAGEPLDSYQKILNYARGTKTAYLDRRNYPYGLKPTPEQVASLRLYRHETLPEWNYTIKPQL